MEDVLPYHKFLFYDATDTEPRVELLKLLENKLPNHGRERLAVVLQHPCENARDMWHFRSPLSVEVCAAQCHNQDFTPGPLRPTAAIYQESLCVLHTWLCLITQSPSR